MENILVFLTTLAAEPPRVERGMLTEFLRGRRIVRNTRGKPSGDVRIGPAARMSPYPEIISRDPRWLRLLALEAKRAVSTLRPLEHIEGEGAELRQPRSRCTRRPAPDELLPA